MSLPLHEVILNVVDEMRRAAKARGNCAEAIAFAGPRDAMLMAHAEWHRLIAAVNEAHRGRDDRPVAVCCVRLAAVLVKAAADLGGDGCRELRGELSTASDGRAGPEDFDYVVTKSRPGEKQ